MLIVIWAVDTRDEQLARLVRPARGIDGKPVRVCPVEFLVGAVRVHPGEDHELIFMRGAAQLAEQVASAQLLRRAVQRHPAGIVGDDSASINDDALGVGAFPLSAPPGDVIPGRIDLRDVRLTPA